MKKMLDMPTGLRAVQIRRGIKLQEVPVVHVWV